MHSRLAKWSALAAASALLSCSSSDGATTGCPPLDFKVTGFSPTSVKSGQSVKVQLSGTAGTTSGACLIEFHFDCGGQDTRYFMGVRDGQPAAGLVLHCDAATAPVACSYSFAYPRDNPTNSGKGDGPTCQP